MIIIQITKKNRDSTNNHNNQITIDENDENLHSILALKTFDFEE